MQESAKIRPALVLGAGAIALALGFVGGFALKRSPSSSDASSAREAAPEWAREERTPAVVRTASASATDSVSRYLIPVSDSQPIRGSEDALVTVVEWCDLRGDPCRAADKAMAELMQKYKSRLRWVHRHHIDKANFAASMRLHAFARGAFQYSDPDNPEKFWEVREKLLALPGADIPNDEELRRIAKEVGVDYEAIAKGVESKAFAGGMAIDTSFEPRFGITTSPAFFVNGRRVPLFPNVDMKRSIDALVAQEMVMSKRLGDSLGKRGTALYEEITKNGLWALNDDPSKHAPSRFATKPQPRAAAMQSQN